MARLPLGYDGDGRRIRWEAYASTRRQAAAQLAQAVKRQETGEPVLVEIQTVRHYLNSWLNNVVQSSVRPTTYHSYEQYCRVHLNPNLGHIQLQKLAPQHVQNMMWKMSDRGLAPRTVQYARAILRASLNRPFNGAWSIEMWRL